MATTLLGSQSTAGSTAQLGGLSSATAPNGTSTNQALAAATPSSDRLGATGGLKAWAVRTQAAWRGRGVARDSGPSGQREFKADEHLLSAEEVARRYGTQFNVSHPEASLGLDPAVAAEQLRVDGPNALTPPKQTPEIVKFLKHFLNPFMILLNLAGILSCITYAIDSSQILNVWLGLILFGIVILNCIISYAQERQSSNVMRQIRRLLPAKCRVIRGGHEQEILADKLVVGDLVRFQLGDRIPADLRVVTCEAAKIECSSITGESQPVTCTTTARSERAVEAGNLIFSSCLVHQGAGLGIVIRTGDRSFIGSIASLASATQATVSTLNREINRFVIFIAVLSIVMAIVFFIVGVARGQSPLYTFVNGFLVIIVANVPQGLPATVTSVLTIAAKRLAGQNVYIKRLEIIETLGSTTVVASDKTGTLTQNLMSVISLWTSDGHTERVDGEVAVRQLAELAQSQWAQPLLVVAYVCNAARFHDDTTQLSEISVRVGGTNKFKPAAPIDERRIVGDASDIALFRFCHAIAGMDDIRNRMRTVFTIPFNSANKWMLTVVEDAEEAIRDEPHHLVLLKGAPEIVLAMCATYQTKKGIRPLDDEGRESVRAALFQAASNGERVLAFAHQHLHGDAVAAKYTDGADEKGGEPVPKTGFTFLGLISLADPPRPNVATAVATLKGAGIRVFMVTGDHPVTAEAIARKIGIIYEGRTVAEVARIRGCPVEEVGRADPAVQAVAVTGTELTTLDEAGWAIILEKKEVVFARTTPTQKLEIVERLQQRNEVVAVTGDGVNDAPALKRADVGVAMGQMGSDVAREAADIVLLTDDFASITDAVKMGRVVFDNLKKTIAYTLTHLWPEVVPVMCYLAFSLPNALSSLQILVIDLGTELAPAISLAYEEPEDDIMQRTPRDRTRDRLATAPLLLYAYLEVGIIETLGAFIPYFLVFTQAGIPASWLPFAADTYFKAGAPDLVVPDGRVYDASAQLQLLSFAQSAYWMTLVLGQFWHIWMVRGRKESAFRSLQRYNVVLYLGVTIEVALVVLFIYVPFIQVILGTAPVAGIYWVFNLVFLAAALPYTELTKLWARRYPCSWAARALRW